MKSLESKDLTLKVPVLEYVSFKSEIKTKETK